ncbi:hypothetical protein BDV98DRAFT_518442, partial [Pterulicium gracile]
VTEEEVCDALFSISAGTAPGSTQIPYRALRWAWPTSSIYITALMQKCLSAGYHPKQWQCAVAIVL